MYIVAIAWMFVVLLMTAAEATSTQGSLLGAFFTLLLYGLIPLSVLLYIMGTPARKRARLRAEQAAQAQTAVGQDSQDASPASAQPDGGGVAPRHPVSAEGEKP
jgi:membrane protein implicated in regulation of membrane protease activity